MHKNNLIPLTSSKAREIGIIGGSVTSDAKKYAQLKDKSPYAMCKNCKASCIFKETNIEKRKNHRCIVPEARAKAIWYNQAVMSEEVLDKIGSQNIFKMIKACKSPNELKLLDDVVSRRKLTDYPKAQKIEIDKRSIDINIVVTEDYDDIIKRLSK